MENFISEKIDLSKVEKNKLNLVVSSCGTGKTFYCANELLSHFKGIENKSVLFVTSRSLAAEQQVDHYDTLIRMETDENIIDYWSGNDCVLVEDKIHIITYDKLKTLLFKGNQAFMANALNNVDMIILDEVHALFSDTFNEAMRLFQIWMYYEVKKGNKYFFGLTATPGILYKYVEDWGVSINPLNEPIQKYKVKQLWVTDQNQMVNMVNNDLSGKTAIMCRSSRTCYTLNHKIDGSAVLTSRHGEDYISADMDNLRGTIVKNFSLPDNVKVLLATTTAREGFTFTENSNIRNIVCYLTDEMDIHQFVGRCRYDIDNLIIVNTVGTSECSGYFLEQRNLFDEFCKDSEHNTEWFENISDIIEHNASQTKISVKAVAPTKEKVKKPKEINPYIGEFRNKDSQKELKKYIDQNWLSKNKSDIFKRIYSDIDKDKILSDIQGLGIFLSKNIPWRRLEKILANEGYSISGGRSRDGTGQLARYRIITKK